MKRMILALAALAVSGTASAQSVESTVQTSVGVPVRKWSDEFAGRYEFASPDVNFTIENGDMFSQSANVTFVRKADGNLGPRILVMVAYNGDWKYFNSAIFQGGEAIKFVESDRSVISCRGGCSMQEAFFLVPTKAQLAKHGASGTLTFQIRSKNTTAAIIKMPMSYFAAIEEAAKR